MARKRKRTSLERVIIDLSRDNARLSCANLNEAYCSEIKDDAAAYLRELQAIRDAGAVADMDVAEIGAIVRRQRERIAFLEQEQRTWRRDYESACAEAEKYARTLRQMGAL